MPSTGQTPGPWLVSVVDLDSRGRAKTYRVHDGGGSTIGRKRADAVLISHAPQLVCLTRSLIDRIEQLELQLAAATRLGRERSPIAAEAKELLLKLRGSGVQVTAAA